MISNSIIGDNEIKQKIVDDKEFNFLAFIYTPWHAHGVAAVITKLHEQGEKIRGRICICEHPQTGYILSSDLFVDYSDEVETVYYKENKDDGFEHIQSYLLQIIKPIKTDGRRIVLVTPNFFQVMLYSKIYVYVTEGCLENYIVDEGLATYMRNEKDFMSDSAEVSTIKKIWRNIRYNYLDKIYLEKVTRAGLLYDFRLLKKAADCLEANGISIQYYKEALKNLIPENRIIDVSMYEEAIIINTQPFWDEGEIRADEDIRVIQEVCYKLFLKGKKIVLKPHPREKRIERYECLKKYVIIDTNNDLSQESVLAVVGKKPQMIIAFSSTTLVSAKLFFDIKTISIAKFLKKENISDKMLKEERCFINTFEELVLCPQTVDDLISMI